MKNAEAAEAGSGSSVAHATLWTVLDFALGRGLAFAVMVVLARIVTPAEFGTVALLALFIGLANLLVESGLGQALVQRTDITEADLSTVFWCNTGIAVLGSLVLVALAGRIAELFAQPVLVPLTWIMAASVFLGAFATVHRACLMREMAFRAITIVRLLASAISGLVAVVIAVKGYGIFALAAQTCVAAGVTSAAMWVACRWRPKRVFDPDSVRKLFGFGGYVLAAGFLETIYTRLYSLLIGKLNGPAELGQYARAESTSSLVSGLVVYPMTQVVLPAFARLDGDRQKVAGAMRTGLQAAMLINAPAMLGLAVVAEPFIRLCYGPNWGPAVPILQILCLGSVFMPIHVLNLQVLMALGRSDMFFRLEVMKKVAGIAILVAAAPWGAEGVAWGVVIASALAAVINTWFSGRIFDYGMGKQFRHVLPCLAIAMAVALGAMWGMRVAADHSDLMRLLGGVAPGIVVFGIAYAAARYTGLVVAMAIPNPFRRLRKAGD